MGGKNWFEISGVSKIRGFEKSGVKLQCLTEAIIIQGKSTMVRKIEVSKSRDSTVRVNVDDSKRVKESRMSRKTIVNKRIWL